MNRAVYIGGFGNGNIVANSVAEALGAYYKDVDPFTFSHAMDNPEKIRKAVHCSKLPLSIGSIYKPVQPTTVIARDI